MLQAQSILIVEDEALIGMELADAVEGFEGEAFGPISSVREALAFLDRQAVAAAILDVQLIDRDITPVALLLVEAGIPFVVHTGTGLPMLLAEKWPDLPVLMKPTPAEDVVKRLCEEMSRLRMPLS